MSEEIHTQITAEEIAQAFDEEAAPVDLSRYAIEDWVTLGVFWGMAICVFLQFFTRYVLNNSLAWTEEIAINCLVVVVFLGSVMCTRMTRHIHVDVLYHYLPAGVGRYLALAVNLITIGFFAYMAWLLWRYVGIFYSERMVTIDLPRSIVF
jgi:TRAP-type C4-dicarboxylate transport system permease small subunit